MFSALNICGDCCIFQLEYVAVGVYGSVWQELLPLLWKRTAEL